MSVRYLIASFLRPLIFICYLSDYTIFLHMISAMPRFSIKNIEHNICILILSTLLYDFSLQEEPKQTLSHMYIRLHVKYKLFLSDFIEN
jgi:hypothetical protein